MNSSSMQSQPASFDFDFYRFNGKGIRPSLVPSPDQANFMRSRYSIPESALELAIQRVQQWARTRRIGVVPKKPYPSSAQGKYWLEFRFGGLTL